MEFGRYVRKNFLSIGMILGWGEDETYLFVSVPGDLRAGLTYLFLSPAGLGTYLFVFVFFQKIEILTYYNGTTSFPFLYVTDHVEFDYANENTPFKQHAKYLLLTYTCEIAAFGGVSLALWE